MSLAFYRQSLQIQQLLAELFHNAMALRGIDAPDDVQNMPPQQRELAINSLGIAQQALTICVSSSSYREGLKYGMCNRLFLVSIYVDLEFSGSLYTCYCNICGIILIEAWSSVVSRFTMLMILYCDVFVSISPDHCDSESIRALVEKLIAVLSESEAQCYLFRFLAMLILLQSLRDATHILYNLCLRSRRRDRQAILGLQQRPVPLPKV